MSTEPIVIKVTKTGDKEAAQGIAAIGTAAATAGAEVSTFNGFLGVLKSTLGVLGVGVAVRELQQQADAYTGIINRIRLVSSSQADLVQQEQALFNAAQSTRGSFEATADLYAKLALQAGNLGIETKSLIPTLTTINKAIAISGTSSQQAKLGLIQLSQGLAANRLQGQDLRAVFEDIPILAQTIAKGLGISTAALRTVAAQGTLTAKTVLEAIDKQAPEIQKQFASLTPTIGQAFQVLENSALRFIGQLDKTNGTSQALAQAIIFLGNNFSTLIGIVATATTTFLAFKTAALLAPVFASLAAGIAQANLAVQGYVQIMGMAGLQTTVFSRLMVALNTPIAAVRSAFLALWAVIAANPFTILLTVIAAVSAAVYFFGNSINVTADGSITVLGAVIGIWRSLGQAITYVEGLLAPYLGPIWQAIIGAAAPVINLLVQGFQLLGSILNSLFPQLQATGGVFGTIVQNMKDATAGLNSTGLAAADLGNAFGGAGLGGPSVAEGAEKATKKTKDLIDGLLQMGRIDPKLQWDAWGKAIDDWGKIHDRNVKAAQKQLQDYIAQVDKNIAETQKMALVTRNAFGDMVTATSEWARRSGETFNQVAGQTNAISSANDTLADSYDKVATAASSATAAAQSFTSASTFRDTNQQIVNYATAAGGDKNAVQDAVAAVTTWEQKVGTPSGGAAIIAAYKALSNLPAAAAHAIAANVPQLNTFLGSAGLPTFRYGGSFGVGGAGGPDSQLVQFLASPDEHVTVETPSQRRRRIDAENGNTDRRAQRPLTVNMQVVTPDANSFNRSQTQTLLTLKSKLNSVAGRA